MTFFEQLLLPYMMLVPHRWFRCFAAVAEIFFQSCIVGTGNYAWINYVGVLPCIALFDDEFIEMLERNIFGLIYKRIATIFSTTVEYVKHKLFCIWPVLEPEDGFETNKLTVQDRELVSYIIKNHIVEQTTSLEDKTKNNTKTKFRDILLHLFNATKNLYAVAISSFYHFAILCLLAFMIYKSKDPIKELFGPAPWINSYDNYFFMTSQGLFVCMLIFYSPWFRYLNPFKMYLVCYRGVRFHKQDANTSSNGVYTRNSFPFQLERAGFQVYTWKSIQKTLFSVTLP